MSERLNIPSGAKWESLVGYSRAVRIGPFVHVTGTTAFGPDGDLVGVGDAAVQTRQCFENIRRALVQAGASFRDVVRTRMYVTDISQWETIGRVHGEIFGQILPATTMVEVSGLIDPRMMVEIEADAYVGDDAGDSSS